MERVASIILGGGEGSRLFPLTRTRCKPAVTFAGRYRLIDVPISNSLNSHINKIYVITQFLSSSLHRHLIQTYRLNSFSKGFIELLAAEQKPTSKMWFQGTADAVRQNIEHFKEAPVDYFLILSGDQLYNIRFEELIAYAKDTDADLVIATNPVTLEETERFGILKVDKQHRVTDFVEKTNNPHLREQFRTDLSRLNPDSSQHQFLASMGIYVFKREALFKLLEEDTREDFGKHLIPTQIAKGGAAAWVYNGYWEDIGTVESFHRANLSMTSPNPRFNSYDENNLIYTYNLHLPGPKVICGNMRHAIICEGSHVHAAEITDSILGPRSVVKEGSVIRQSYIMGNDFYTSPMPRDSKQMHLEIGENCLLSGVILDKNVRLGKGVKLTNERRIQHYDADPIFIRDGIIVVTRGASLPEGFTL